MATPCRPTFWRKLQQHQLSVCRIHFQSVVSTCPSRRHRHHTSQHKRQLTTTSIRCNESSAAPIFESQNQGPLPTSSPAITQESTQSTLAEKVRHFMRHVAHPVVLVTTSSASISGKNSTNPHNFDDCLGATISSFTTVSLGPPPYIIFNLRRPSRTLASILDHGHFRLTALHAGEEGERIAQAFLDYHHKNAFNFLQSRELADLRIENEPVQSQHQETADSAVDRVVYAPKLTGSGILGSFDCQAVRDKCIEVGDHTLVVAEVIAAPSKVEDVDGVRATSLLYYHQNFGVPSRLSTDRKESGSTNASSEVTDVRTKAFQSQHGLN